MAKKIVKKNTKKKEFDWRKLLLGLKRPLIALIGCGLTYLATKPHWAWLAVGGVTAERVWSTFEFYVKR